jgi:hypothetical protein
MGKYHRARAVWLAAALLALAPTAALAQHNVDVYRAVAANGGGNADLGNTAFNFNGAPAALSLFDLANRPASPCYYRFTVTGVPNNPPQPNDQGQLAGPVVPPPGAGTFTTVFDNNPAGHWGALLPAGVTNVNARAAVSQYARANRGNVVNGTQANCH